jgi:hypothetical protein
MGVQLVGMDKLLTLVRRHSGNVVYLQGALFDEATVVLNESKKQVPYEFSTLMNSGRVERPQVSGDELSVEITYGGAAASYAGYVHEIPKNYNHGRKYKYLEDPANAYVSQFTRNIARRFLQYVRSGR